MKHTLLILTAMVLTACEGSGSGSSKAVNAVTEPALVVSPEPISTPALIVAPSVPAIPTATPIVSVPTATPTPTATPFPATPTPAPTATPVATPTPSPTPTVTKTSSYGSLSCQLLSDTTIRCSDGTTTAVSANNNFVDVIVGAGGVGCGLQRSYNYVNSAKPTRCIGTGTCANPATYYDMYCWAGMGQAPVLMHTQAQITPMVPYSSWVSGPQSLYLETTTNKVCIEQTVAELGTNLNWHGNSTYSKCGTVVNATNGYLN